MNHFSFHFPLSYFLHISSLPLVWASLLASLPSVALAHAHPSLLSTSPLSLLRAWPLARSLARSPTPWTPKSDESNFIQNEIVRLLHITVHWWLGAKCVTQSYDCNRLNSWKWLSNGQVRTEIGGGNETEWKRVREWE